MFKEQLLFPSSFYLLIIELEIMIIARDIGYNDQPLREKKYSRDSFFVPNVVNLGLIFLL